MWLDTTRLARGEKDTTQTVRRWIEAGRYEKVERTYGGHYRVWVSGDPDPDTVLYCRVSSAKQVSSLNTQERLLLDRYPDGTVIRDTGSGFDFKRQGFVAILERALRGEAIHLVATTSDRIARSGYPLIRHVIEISGGSIELLAEDGVVEQFDIRTPVAHITSFCNSHHGKRAGQRHTKSPGVPEEAGDVD